MIKALFLAPGRLVSKLFSKDKRRQYRSVRQRQAGGPGVGLLSLLVWLLLLGGLIVLADKSGFLTEALDMGVEAVSGASDNSADEDQGPSALADGAKAALSGPPPALAQPAETAESVESAAVVGESLQRSELWLVILDTIPKSARDEAERLQIRYRNRGLEVEIMDTDNFPLLLSGYWIIAQGPFDSRADALAAGNIAGTYKSDLIVRRGL